jgi:hypothetical protein
MTVAPAVAALLAGTPEIGTQAKGREPRHLTLWPSGAAGLVGVVSARNPATSAE